MTDLALGSVTEHAVTLYTGRARSTEHRTDYRGWAFPALIANGDCERLPEDDIWKDCCTRSAGVCSDITIRIQIKLRRRECVRWAATSGIMLRGVQGYPVPEADIAASLAGFEGPT